MNPEHINKLRHLSRKLIRELGMLQVSKGTETRRHWHALIEISRKPDMTISQIGELLLLSISAASRIISALIKQGFVRFKDGADKREKHLTLTPKGQAEIEKIDVFSNTKIQGAFEYLSENDQNQIIDSIEKYGNALEKSRLLPEQAKIHTLSTSRTLRKQVINFIKNIQIQEFSIPIDSQTNLGIMKSEDEYYYNNSTNFWYATDKNGKIIGSVGLKKINSDSGEVKKFFVDKTYRGKGLAHQLMSTVLKAALKHRFKSLYLGTVDKLKAASHFYTKHGFSAITKKQLPPEFKILHLDNVFMKASI
ncbi:MAG: bifunctional helix-turn-helix transcriptional regulator/GNAT family N-acetyltransferase [Myxococcaceae bacterium]